MLKYVKLRHYQCEL